MKPVSHQKRLEKVSSPPTRGRGLKPAECLSTAKGKESPPTRGRGLKPLNTA